ncbi:hypothetical protein KEM52_004644, partial [Ascosphaera acerosa]
VLAEFTEHESMNYASGVWVGAPGSAGAGAGSREAEEESRSRSRSRTVTCVSSSFYDKRLCLWKARVDV